MSEKTREAFEAWFAQQPQNGGKRPNRATDGDGYFTNSTDRMWQAWLSSRRQALEEAAAIAKAATARTRRVRAMCNTEPIKPCAIAAAIRREAEGK